MPRAQAPVYSLNGGEVGKEAIQRLDLEKMRYAGELYENIIPKVVGPFQLRGGFGFKDDSAVNEADNLFIKFVFGSTDNSLLQFSSDGMRIFDGDAYLARAAVSTAITNGDFDSFTGWTDLSTGSGTASVSGGNLVLDSASGSTAVARQEIAVSASDDTVEHGLALEIVRGPVSITLGTTAGDNDILSASNLEEGSHRLAFTPGDAVTSVFLDIINDTDRDMFVDSATIEAAGDIVVNHPWAVSDFTSLKYDQSSDVIFVSSGTFQQRRIERRGATSWSIVRYKVSDGPFDILPDETISLTPAATIGNTTLTASDNLFDETDVGSLFRVIHFSQLVTDSLVAVNDATEPVLVTSVGENRKLKITISGTWVGTIFLERAFTEPTNYSRWQTYTANVGPVNVNDELDNQVVYYRFRFDAYTSGTADVELDFPGGTTLGIGRVTAVTNSTTADIEVLAPFGDTTASNQWDRGTWSDRNGWPTSVVFFDGRLWWGRGGVVFGSVSDAFDSYDDETVGDSAPVVRSIGTNTAEGILWLLGLQRLAAGTGSAEVSIRASSFDEPITATNFVPRNASTRGSTDIAAVQVDSEAVFVQRSGTRAFRYTFTSEKNDYFSFDLTQLHREILEAGVKKIDVQRNPDTRIWFLLNNGELRCLVYEFAEGVVAWCRVVLPGAVVDDFAILPSAGEDRVFVIAQRTINASTVRYIEEMATFDETIGGTLNKVADSFIAGNNATASTTITGLDHLEGESIIVWGNGTAINDQDSPVTVSGGNATVSAAITGDWIAGLAYDGLWTSTKLAYGSGLGTALTQRKRVSHLGLVMNNVAPDGVKIGDSFNDLVSLRKEYKGRTLDPGEVLAEYDYDASQFNGNWNTDSRVNIKLSAPYPATVSAIVISMKTNDMGG